MEREYIRYELYQQLLWNHQNDETKSFMIITKYCELGDLTHHVIQNFYNMNWLEKLIQLKTISTGLKLIHKRGVIHRDFHSSNILVCNHFSSRICDLGISKSAIESNDDDEIHGIIPYVAPEVFRGKEYTTALMFMVLE